MKPNLFRTLGVDPPRGGTGSPFTHERPRHQFCAGDERTAHRRGDDRKARSQRSLRRRGSFRPRPRPSGCVDGRSYRARIYPIPANGTRRVVLKYMQILSLVENKTRFVYPLRSDDPVRFDEFALTVDMGEAGPEMRIASSLDARVKIRWEHMSIRRSGYVPQADFQLEFEMKKASEPLRAWRFAAGADQADYVIVRYVPDLDFAKLRNVQGDIAVVVDTSAAGDKDAPTAQVDGRSNPPSSGAWRSLHAHRSGRRSDGTSPRKGVGAGEQQRNPSCANTTGGHTASGATNLAAIFRLRHSAVCTEPNSPPWFTSATAPRPRGSRHRPR